MARPSSARAAAWQAQALLLRRLPGPRATTVREHLERARQIGRSLYRRWQIGPYQWRVKHVRHYLEHQTGGFEPSTRYRHWLTTRLLCLALQRADWLPRLRGPWERPTGEEQRPVFGGRPSKRPL